MQVAVIGLGSFGSKLAESLYALGGEVIAIDHKEELVEDIKDRVTQAVCLDATDERALRAIGMEDVDTAVVAIANNTEESIMVTTLLRQIGVTRIISRAISNLHERVLKEVGASEVLRIEEEMGEQSARWILDPDILKQFTFASGYSLVDVKPKESFVGKKVKFLRLREKYRLGVAAIHKRIPAVDEDGRSIFKHIISCPPDPEDVVGYDDILVLFGSDGAVLAFTESGE